MGSYSFGGLFVVSMCFSFGWALAATCEGVAFLREQQNNVLAPDFTPAPDRRTKRTFSAYILCGAATVQGAIRGGSLDNGLAWLGSSGGGRLRGRGQFAAYPPGTPTKNKEVHRFQHNTKAGRLEYP